MTPSLKPVAVCEDLTLKVSHFLIIATRGHSPDEEGPTLGLRFKGSVGAVNALFETEDAYSWLQLPQRRAYNPENDMGKNEIYHSI